MMRSAGYDCLKSHACLELLVGVDERSLPPVAPPAMSVVDDSPDMTSLLLDDLTLTPTLLLLHDVIVPWL